MNKRFASLAVSALLLVSLLSVPALAEGTEAAADAAGDDHVIVTLNPEAALQPETPAEAAASATETAPAATELTARGFCHRDGSGRPGPFCVRRSLSSDRC